jgi:hypothetical protein
MRELGQKVTDIDRTKAEVTRSLSILAVRCDKLDKHVPELKEKLEIAINTVMVCPVSSAVVCVLFHSVQ